MKKLLLGLVVVIATVISSSGQSQGTAVRALNGFGTNLTTIGTVTNKNSAGTAIITLTPVVSGPDSQLRINGVPVGSDVIIGDGEITADRYNGVNSPSFVSAGAPGFTGHGGGLTNILEKNIAVTTNGWGVSVINFELGTSIDTNMSGNLTLTGVSGFVTTNLNWQTIGLNPNGVDRVITVPNEWLVSGFTNATAVTLPLTNIGILRIECVIGRRTNASLEIYFP